MNTATDSETSPWQQPPLGTLGFDHVSWGPDPPHQREAQGNSGTGYLNLYLEVAGHSCDWWRGAVTPAVSRGRGLVTLCLDQVSVLPSGWGMSGLPWVLLPHWCL